MVKFLGRLALFGVLGLARAGCVWGDATGLGYESCLSDAQWATLQTPSTQALLADQAICTGAGTGAGCTAAVSTSTGQGCKLTTVTGGFDACLPKDQAPQPAPC